jgi:hypothetical protein
MKKIRAYIIVDLNVGSNLTNDILKEMISVGKYKSSLSYQEDTILLYDKDFEVIDYVDIGIENIK